MRYIALFILLPLCLFLAGCSSKPPALYNKQGRLWTLSQFKGNWVVLNYWAAWCESCRKEIPQLNAFYKQEPKQVALIGVNYDGIPVSGLKTVVNKLDIKYPVLATNPAKHFKLPTIPALPVTFIINPQGKIVKTLYGPNTVKKLDSLMASLQGHAFLVGIQDKGKGNI